MAPAIIESTASTATSAPTPEALAGLLQAVAVRRDRDAFEGLFRYFAPRLKSYMRRLGADDAAAEDLAQETMVMVWRKAGYYDASKAMPSAWVFTMARNLRIDRLRRQRFQEVPLLGEADCADEPADTDDRVVERIDANKLAGLLEALPRGQLEVVRLAFYEGLSHSEIGERLAVPLGTVKSRLRLAFAKLRAAFGDAS